MLVHLYGRCSHTPRIADICRRYNLILLEDNAQAHGCSVQSSEFTVHGSLNKADKPTSSALPDYALSPKNYALTRTGSLGHAAAHSEPRAARTRLFKRRDYGRVGAAALPLARARGEEHFERHGL